MNWHECEVGSYPENSIVGDSKDTKKILSLYIRRKKKEIWDLW